MIKFNPYKLKNNNRFKLICYVLTGTVLILDTLYSEMHGLKLLSNSYFINGYVVGGGIIIYAFWKFRR